MRISQLKPNPNNPRDIAEADINKAAKSIFCFSEMLRYRPIIYDPFEKISLGGNVRLLGIKWLYKYLKGKSLPDATQETVGGILEGLYKELFSEAKDFTSEPAKDALLRGYYDLMAIAAGEFPGDSVLSADTLTPSQKREFIAKDNGNFGRWNYDFLANEYDIGELAEWGIDVPGVSNTTDPGEDLVDKEEEQADDDSPPSTKWVPDCLFESNNEFDIPTLRPDLQATQVLNPVAPWGYSARDARNIGTYHFYVDDYRFTGLWDDPNKLIKAGVPIIIEPNLSLYDNTPRGYGLFLIYKKRWIARYWQSFGVRVFVDLNVSYKFKAENLLGVPKGWNAYATRGYADRLQLLEEEFNLAKEHSGKEDPYFIVYGGGEKVRKWVRDNNLTYLEQVMADKFK